MKKRIFAAISAVSIFLSLCACAAEQPEEPTTEQTTGVQDTTGVKDVPEDFRWLTYEEYQALTPEQQQAYYESFPTPEEYMVWFNAVTKEHNQSGDNSLQEGGNEGQITQPIEPEEKPTEDPETPTQKPEKEDPETPTQQPTNDSQEKKDPVLLTYEEYLKLSPALQQAYYESFPSVEAYMQWFNAAAKEYNESNKPPQAEGDEGQITQPEESSPIESTEPTEKKNFLEGHGTVTPGRG